MVQQFIETGHPVFKGISALSRGVFAAEEKQMYHSLQRRFFEHRPRVPNSCHSVNQFSVYGAVSNWCYQFGSTHDEKGRTIFTVDNNSLIKLKPEEVQLSVSLPKRATGNRMPERVQSFEEIDRRYI